MNKQAKKGHSVTDHAGRTFASFNEMCRAWNQDSRTVRSRLGRGWPLRKALETRPGTGEPNTEASSDNFKGKPCTGPDGREFPSITAMAKTYGIRPGALRNRLRSGWPLSNALSGVRPKKLKTDSAGRPYESISAIAREAGMTWSVLYRRLRSGMTIEDAIAMPVRSRKRTYKDASGTVYETCAAMLEANGTTKGCYNARISKGWDPAKAASAPPRPVRHPVTTTDGTRYETEKEFCKAIGLDPSLYRQWKRNGLDTAEIERRASLRTPGSGRRRPCIDGNGTPYGSISALAKAHLMSPSLVISRINAGWPVEDAVSTMPAGMRFGSLSIKAHIDGIYHLIDLDGKEDIWTHAKIVRYAKAQQKKDAAEMARANT